MSPIATILCRVTDELRKVAERLDTVQGAVGELVFDSTSPRAAHLRDLQNLDRATQEIAAIATFLETLSNDLPGHWVADPKSASQVVGLHDLATVLGHHEADARPAHAPAAEHECEIFD